MHFYRIEVLQTSLASLEKQQTLEFFAYDSFLMIFFKYLIFCIFWYFPLSLFAHGKIIVKFYLTWPCLTRF